MSTGVQIRCELLQRTGWTLTYFGEEWRWVSEPYGRAVKVDGAWRELKDAGDELPEAVKRDDGDSGLQSQEALAQRRANVHHVG